jgi:glycoside/pentoside/hexuronide:cation symporter, GPH family
VASFNAGLAGSILLISKVWDAINEEIVGMLSDRTQSRWGRRHPWMLFAVVGNSKSPFRILPFSLHQSIFLY